MATKALSTFAAASSRYGAASSGGGISEFLVETLVARRAASGNFCLLFSGRGASALAEFVEAFLEGGSGDIPPTVPRRCRLQAEGHSSP